MKKVTIIILILVFVITTGINILILSKTKTCTYDVKTDYYKETTKVEISHFKDIKVIKEYEFESTDILNKEEELLKKDEYNISIDNNKLKATKNLSKDNYYKSIRKYEELGFICK